MYVTGLFGCLVLHVKNLPGHVLVLLWILYLCEKKKKKCLMKKEDI